MLFYEIQNIIVYQSVYIVSPQETKVREIVGLY